MLLAPTRTKSNHVPKLIQLRRSLCTNLFIHLQIFDKKSAMQASADPEVHSADSCTAKKQ